MKGQDFSASSWKKNLPPYKVAVPQVLERWRALAQLSKAVSPGAEAGGLVSNCKVIEVTVLQPMTA